MKTKEPKWSVVSGWCLGAMVAMLATVALMAMAGCEAGPKVTPADLQQLNDSLHAAQQVSTDFKGQLAELKAQAATQPGGGKVITDALAPVEKVQAKIDTNLNHAVPIVNAAAVAANQPDASPIKVIIAGVNAAEPIIPSPYREYVAMGLLGLTALDSLLQRLKNKKTAAAAQANTDALSAAIASKQITVNQPSAAMAVDAIVADHPIGDRLVDVIAAGAAAAAAK